MCFGGGDDEAQASRMDSLRAQQEQKDAEAQRQQRITEGQGQIEQAFSQFTPEYYKGFQDKSVAANTPQIEEQYARAKDKATALLTGRGVLKSNIAGNALGDIEKTRATTLGQVATDAVTQANALRSAVEKQKTDLYTLNLSAGDPAALGNRAIGESTALVAQPATTALGDIFASSLNAIGGAAKADAYSPYGGRISSYFNAPPTSSRDNVRGA